MPKKYMRNGHLVTAFKVENPEGPNRNPDLYAWVGAVASETHRQVEAKWDKDPVRGTYVLSLMFSDGFKIELLVGQYLVLDEQGQWTHGEEGDFDAADPEPTSISDTPDGQTLIDFGSAIQMLKDGARVARIGWNGKGMWLKLIDGSHNTIDVDYIIRDDSDCGAHIDGLQLLPWIGMKTADGGFVPWLASQTDILASDWVIVV